jgi:hypothetical protein
MRDLRRAAAAAGVSVAEAGWNIPRTLTVATTPAWPPPMAGLTSRPVLVWDVDGVLAFTAEALTAALNARFGTAYSPQSQGFFTGRISRAALPPEQAEWLVRQFGSIVPSMAPDWHAADTMTTAAAAGYPTVIVTERSPELAGPTRQWLSDWGIAPPPLSAVGPGQKPAWMAARFGPASPAVLIDDNALVRRTIARPGVETWLPARPYNSPAPERVHTRLFTSWPAVRYWLGLAPEAVAA